jgi:Family of unknown function (DUF6350)
VGRVEELREPRPQNDDERRLLAAGWGVAAVGAAAAALAAAAVAQALAFLLAGARLLPGTSAADAAREGWLLFYLFHHVGIEVLSPSFHLPGGAEKVAGLPSHTSVDATVAFAFMGGTAMVMWMLARAGRRVAEAAGGSPGQRGVHGAKVALPYALIAWGASWGLSFRPPFPGTSLLSIHPSHLASLFWPLAIAAVAGSVGGVRSAGGAMWTSDWWTTDRWNRRWRGALSGGWRMLWVGLAAAFASVLGLAAARPDVAVAYFRTTFRWGVPSGVGLLGLHAMAIPNMAAWTLVPAMGGCLEVNGTSVFEPYCFMSYSHYVGHPLPGPLNASGYPNLGGIPPGFFLFLLVPLVAVILGGMHAARKAAVRTAGEAVGVGALAGGAFALMFVAVLALAAITARFNGPIFIVSTGYWRFGPGPAAGFQLAMAWGALGGAAGAMIARGLGRRRMGRPPPGPGGSPDG